MLNCQDAFERQTVPVVWTAAEVERLMHLRSVLGWDWGPIARELGRTESGVKSKFKYEMHSRVTKAPSLPFVREPVPDSVLIEQARRVVAFGCRSVTQAILGDPPHQYSALGQRRAIG